jgi:TIR domain
MSNSVFISHAVDDRSLVDPFQELLALGVGLNPAEIFYSSGAGTGIPAGKNFVQHIRDEMKGASFVVAVITPNSLRSEFCMAELGAVWYASDKEFFPICTPGVDRASLRATLTGIQVEKVDDAAALAGLLQRLCDHFGRDHVAASCTARIGIFLKELPGILDNLPQRQLVPAADLEELEKVNQELLESLAETRGELGESEKRFEELYAAKTTEEAAAVKRPGDLEGQIAELLTRAKAAVRKLTPGVRRSLPFQLKDEPAPWPDGGSYEHQYVREAVEAGFLVDGDEPFLDLNTQWPDIKSAVDALEELQRTFAELDEDGERWFIETYAVPPDLTQAAAFDELL